MPHRHRRTSAVALLFHMYYLILARISRICSLSVFLASDGPEGSRDTDVIKHVVRRSMDIRMGISIRYTSE